MRISFETQTLDWFLERLDLEGTERRGEQDYLVRCPAHDDYRPSLHVWVDSEGKLGVHCFAGCGRADIEEMLADAEPVATPQRIKQVTRREVGRVVAVYDYRDSDSNLVYRKRRFEPKSFDVQRPGAVQLGVQFWTAGLKDRDGRFVVEPIPYRLPELLAADEVWVVDGEKDADRLTAEGVVATCGPFGMARWEPSWSGWLARRRVVVVADRDEAGFDAAERIRGHLPGCRVLAAAEGKDASDHLDAGCTLDDFQEVTP